MKIIRKENKTLLVLDGTLCEKMESKVLVANTTDAATEKHVPVCTFNEGVLEVNVGSVAHPMVEEHYIAWILVETKDGHLFKRLAPNQEPLATFHVVKEDVVAVYEYCNLHGLWKVEI